VKHGGFCSQECFQNAQKDWLVKNVAWDPFDYKLTVRQAKRAWGDTETQLMQSLQENITKRFGGATFNHAVSQKESAIVMD
jgi:hypothetical protein